MLNRFVPAAVAAVFLAGLAFASPASAATLPDGTYGCPQGYFCLYTADGRVIPINQDKNSQYPNIRSFFNNSMVGIYDHVLVSYVYSNGAAYTKCIPPADGDPAAGHETVDSPVTVTRIQWRRENCAA
ncbi:peptidase inhibitor family I36 protein [Nonomuraea sp. NPDC001831]|uniref:peptidase inhibitor family I36 protein n=1 Tax=Nonomuraea sp. NPDC001831 TaxID=3364340 RepID=UPI0036C47286